MAKDQRRLFLVKRKAMEEIDQFDVVKGWSKAPSPFLGDDTSSLHEAIQNAGFEVFAKLGSDLDIEVTIHYHSKDDRFLIGVWGMDTGREILVDGLPSLVEILSKLGGIATAGTLQSLAERLSDLETLMTGEGGPLEPAVLARNRQRHLDEQKRKRARANDKPQD